MAGVGSALVADDDIVLLGQQIDDFSLGFVSPLQPDDASARQVNDLEEYGGNNGFLTPECTPRRRGWSSAA